MILPVLPFAVLAQTTSPPSNSAAVQAVQSKTQDFNLDSKLLARKMPYRVILPVSYKTSNEKTFYPVIYLLHGLTGHFDDWANKTKLADYAEKYNYIIVMPEGNNGWYTDSASVPNDRYESYIIKELIPEIDKNFRTAADKKHRAIAGLSMGGYGSIKFGLKYPEMFALAGSFSGALGAAVWTEKEVGARGTAASLLSVYGIEKSETRRNNDIFQMIRDISPDKIKNLPFLYVDCGTEDFLYQNNRDFVSLLQEKKVPHEYRQLPGGHDWKYWNSQVIEFLELSEKFIK